MPKKSNTQVKYKSSGYVLKYSTQVNLLRYRPPLVVWSQIPGRVKKEVKRPLLKDRGRGAAGVQTSFFSKPFKVHRSFRKTLNHMFYIWKYKCAVYCPLYTWYALVCLGLVWELFWTQRQHITLTNQREQTWLRLCLLSCLCTIKKYVFNQSYRQETSKLIAPILSSVQDWATLL